VTVRRVAWRRSDELVADEHCTMTQRDSGLSLVGTVLGAQDGVPVRIEYRVLTDGAGLTTAAHVRDLRGFDQRTVAVERDSKGGWSVDGARVRALRSATDVDLGFSPATNTLPIRRLRLAVGASKTIKAAWIRYPELTIEKADQTYTRIDEFSYRYRSGDFEAELTVDDAGLVAGYAVWTRIGVAIGQDDTAPLDAQR